MGSIGSFKYPDHDIEEAIDIIEIISNENLTDQDVLASRLDHKTSDSGAFRNKLTSLRRYGLIPDRGDIRLTPLAEQIVIPQSGTDEREKAIGEAVDNVDLLSNLYEQLDYSAPDENFFLQIAQVTGADRSEAQDKAPRIERLYKAGLNYVKIYNQELTQKSVTDWQEKSDTSDTNVQEPQASPDADATLTTPDGTTIHIKNEATFSAAIAILDSLGRDEYDVSVSKEKTTDE